MCKEFLVNVMWADLPQGCPLTKQDLMAMLNQNPPSQQVQDLVARLQRKNLGKAFANFRHQNHALTAEFYAPVEIYLMQTFL